MASARVAPGQVTSTFMVSPSCENTVHISNQLTRRATACSDACWHSNKSLRASRRAPLRLLIHWYFRLKKAEIITAYLDLVTGRLVLLSVHPRLEPPVPAHHVLVELLGDVQVRHADQIAAVLRDEQDKK